MAYSTPDDHRSVSHKHQGRAGDSRSGGVTSSGTRRVQARGGSSSQYRNSRNRRSRKSTMSFATNKGLRINGRRGGAVGRILSDYRLLISTVLGIIVLLALIFGLVSAVRGCTNRAAKQKQDETDTDTRVALSVSSDLADRYSQRLDEDDMLAQIAQQADSIDDARLLELALREQSAIEYVYGYLSSNPPTGSQAYTDSVSVGTYPKLYTWDTRWGYVTYGNSPMAFTGSGPTCLAMAYMGLTGKTDRTPATFAAAATTADGIDSVYDTKAEFLTSTAEELELYTQEYAPTAENLSNAVQSGTVVLVQLRERSLTDQAHWALAVSRNLDGSINLYDPTSTAVTEHPWDPNTIAAGADVFYAVSASEINPPEVDIDESE